MGKLIRNDQKRATPEERLRATAQSKPTRYQMTSTGVPVTGAPRPPLPPSLSRRPTTRVPIRAAILPPEDLAPSSHLLITGGIGDFIILESHMEPERRAAVQHITLATRAHKGIHELLGAFPAFPNLKVLSTIQVDWSKVFCFVRREDMEQVEMDRKQLEDAQDWSIYVMFPFIERAILRYQRSSFVSNKIADIGRFNLPPRYIVCNPYSPNDRRSGRDFSENDWEFAQGQAQNQGIPLVVVNVSDDFIPDSPSVINLNRKTSLAESIEVVKGACGYVGIDSCLSIVAAQSLGGEKLLIKSNNGHLYNNKSIYYAPHKHFNFIMESF
jgi:hypothetical protein